jgi:hypothetical protein
VVVTPVIDVQDIERLLEGSREYDEFGDDDYEEFGWYFWLHEGYKDEWTILSPELMARTVKTVGGHEGGGENVEIVVEVSPHVGGIQKFSMESRYFEKLGFYMSHAGCDFDGTFTEVFPKQRTITVYEKE